MLVLSRKVGQEMVIGRDVSVRVLEIRGSRVRVGIMAPEAVSIHRKELRRRINRSTEDSDVDETAPTD